MTARPGANPDLSPKEIPLRLEPHTGFGVSGDLFHWTVIRTLSGPAAEGRGYQKHKTMPANATIVTIKTSAETKYYVVLPGGIVEPFVRESPKSKGSGEW